MVCLCTEEATITNHKNMQSYIIKFHEQGFSDMSNTSVTGIYQLQKYY
jgi:hypothetical protein